MIKLGNKDIVQVHFGLSKKENDTYQRLGFLKIDSIYRGSQQIWGLINSCFGSGIWYDSKFWIDNEKWND